MLKYNIEGGADFFSELYKSLDDADENFVCDKNLCLITGQQLTENFVTLPCGHNFNYIPLYKDAANHKNKFNSMESSTTKLSYNELRCPYCRKRHTMTLPFHENLNLLKVYGVNTLEIIYKPKHNYAANLNPCAYKIANTAFDESKPETEENYKYKFCGCYYASIIYIHNNDNPAEPITFGDSNLYCYKHKKVMIKHYKQESKQKELEAKKQKIAEDKLAKAEAKQKEKDDKKALKQTIAEAKQAYKKHQKPTSNDGPIDDQNVVIGVVNLTGCVQTLKKGANKGSACGCKVFSNNLCRRHYTSEMVTDSEQK